MSVTLQEVRGQRIGGGGIERQFHARGTTSIVEVRAAIITKLTDDGEMTFGGFPLDDINVDEVDFKTYEARLSYKLTTGSGGDPLSATSFDTTGGTLKITRGLDSYRSANAPLSGNLIGVNTDMTVEGVEVPQSAFNFEIRRTMTDEMTSAFQNLIANATCTVNNAAWNTYPKGSVLFLGCRGAQQANGTWDLAFAFSYRKNPGTLSVPGFVDGSAVTLTIGPGTGPGTTETAEGVEGWWASWTFSQPQGQAFGSKTINMPFAVFLYATRVFDYSNFDLLDVL